MVQGRDHIAVAGQLHIGGGIALVITEGAVGEDHQGETLSLGGILGVVEMHRHLPEAAVLLKGVRPGAVNQDRVGLAHRVFAGDRQAIVVGEDESRDQQQRAGKDAQHTARDGAAGLLHAVLPVSSD